jgi:hypothetical protein
LEKTATPNVEFREKFVAFLDVLGFKALVEAAEKGASGSLDKVLGVLQDFGSPDHRRKFEIHGPKVCPQSHYLQRSLDFRVTQVSDSLVVSSEVSPAGAINLINHCWALVLLLLHDGFMCRGYINLGTISHTSENFIGSGYQKAYENEGNVKAFKREADERGTPFVEVDKAVCDYLANSEDACVKEMFSRFAKTDGDVVALFPFQRLAHSFIVAGFGRGFDSDSEKRANNNVRLTVLRMKESVMSLVDASNLRAVKKAEHYIRALDSQLAVCDRTDEMISLLKQGRA